MKHCVATVLSELDGRLRNTYLSLRANVLARIDCIAKFCVSATSSIVDGSGARGSPSIYSGLH